MGVAWFFWWRGVDGLEKGEGEGVGDVVGAGTGFGGSGGIWGVGLFHMGGL